MPAASSVPESLADLQRVWRRCCTEAHHERVALLCACGAARVAAWLRAELPLDLLNGILCALASGFAHKKAMAVNIHGSKTSQADAADAADHSTIAALPDSSACQQEPPAEEGLSLCQAGAASTADAATNSTLAGSSSGQTGVVAERKFMRFQADAAFAADMLDALSGAHGVTTLLAFAVATAGRLVRLTHSQSSQARLASRWQSGC